MQSYQMKQWKIDTTITISVEVTNTGDVKGEEIVQLYIQDVVGEVVRPIKELKGFEKVMLHPGETRTISFHDYRGTITLSSL